MKHAIHNVTVLLQRCLHGVSENCTATQHGMVYGCGGLMGHKLGMDSCWGLTEKICVFAFIALGYASFHPSEI